MHNLGSKQKWVPLEVEPLKNDKKKNNRGGKQVNHKEDTAHNNVDRKKNDKEDLKKAAGM